MDEKVKQFCAVTGCTDEAQATDIINVCAGDLDMAIDMFMENQQTQSCHNDGGSSSSANHEEVRAPIPQKRECIMETDNYLYANNSKRRRSANPNSVFDKFRDFQAEAKQQEMLMREGAAATNSTASAHLTKLEDLFRPPLDLIHHGNLASAQAKGEAENKWILVNVQNTEEFSCQVLNRDIWKDSTIKSLISKSFILWQVYHDSTEGQKYSQFYPIESWPYISILHPVTGELKKRWMSDITLSPFRKELKEFISLYSTPEGPSLPDTKSSSQDQEDRLIEASEESQIQAAIQASLEESSNQSSKKVNNKHADLLFESDSDMADYSDSEAEEDDQENEWKTDPSEEKSESARPADPIPEKLDGSQSTLSKETTSTNWKDYASEEGYDVQIQFRLPNQSRQQWIIKSQSKLKAVILYVEDLGFESKKYEIIANFPRRKISVLDFTKTLEESDIQKQEVLYIQER